MSDFVMTGGPAMKPLTICVNGKRRFEIALSKAQTLMLRYLIASQAGHGVPEDDLAVLAYGLFEPAPTAERLAEDLSAMDLRLASIVGQRVIRGEAGRTYRLEAREFKLSIAPDAPL